MRNLWSRRELIWDLTLLDLKGKYRSSYLGFSWSIFQPVLMLGVYAFLFHVVSRPKWGAEGAEADSQYVLVLFCGIIVFNILGECLIRAPLAVVSRRNYVKKFIFPVEILPVSIVGSALAHFLVSLGVLLIGMAAIGQAPPKHIFLLPLMLLPMLLLCLGLSWLVSMTGVYLRDMIHAMPFVVQVLFFLTPIVYPLSAVPLAARPFFELNVLTAIVEEARNVILFGEPMDWRGWSVAFLAGAAVCALGYEAFMRGKKAFADAL